MENILSVPRWKKDQSSEENRFECRNWLENIVNAMLAHTIITWFHSPIQQIILLNTLGLSIIMPRYVRTVFFCASVFFVLFLPKLTSVEAPVTRWKQVSGGPPVVSIVLYLVHRNALHYKPLAWKFLVTIEVQAKKKSITKSLNESCDRFQKFY